MHCYWWDGPHPGTISSIIMLMLRTTNPNYKQEVDIEIERRIKDVK